jgi:hypothetical protein
MDLRPLVLIAGGPFDAVVLSVAASDIHHVSAVRLADGNSRVRADYDTELFLSRLPESMADALDSKNGRNATALDCGATVRRWRPGRWLAGALEGAFEGRRLT